MSWWLRNESGRDKKQENPLGDYLIIIILRTKKHDENLGLAVIENVKVMMNSRIVREVGKA